MPVESYPEERLVATMNSAKSNGSSLRAVLKGLNLMEYADLLESEDLDLEVLTKVNEEQLERIGVKTLGQRIRILQAAKDASARSEAKSKEHSTEVTTVASQKKATVMIAESGADEGGKKNSEADVERRRLEEKFETFMKNQKASSGGGGFSKAAASKNLSDSTKDSSEEGMLTTGGLLYSAWLLSYKMMGKK